jgi:hypothetical protein
VRLAVSRATRTQLALLAVPVVAIAQSTPDSSRVRVGGFVDAYFAYDFSRPPTTDRSYTTQAARHSEANVNLAFIDATLTGARVRGRLAIQYGTSVQANYAGEPARGAISGPAVSRFLQEAFAGVHATRTLWIDGGIMLAPFGAESWISRDNWTYTRSLIADNSPYYEAGVRATWQAAAKVEAQLHVLNGWQNISETNEDKALAIRLQWTPAPRLVFAYDNFVGNEMPDSLTSRLRVFQEIIARADLNDRTSAAIAFDWGSQRRTTTGSDRWHGFAALARYRLHPDISLGARVEGYSDAQQVIVKTGRPPGMRATGASINVDAQLDPRLVWRTELRLLRDRNRIFPSRTEPSGVTNATALAVVSIALTL